MSWKVFSLELPFQVCLWSSQVWLHKQIRNWQVWSLDQLDDDIYQCFDWHKTCHQWQLWLLQWHFHRRESHWQFRNLVGAMTSVCTRSSTYLAWISRIGSSQFWSFHFCSVVVDLVVMLVWQCQEKCSNEAFYLEVRDLHLLDPWIHGICMEFLKILIVSS